RPSPCDRLLGACVDQLGRLRLVAAKGLEDHRGVDERRIPGRLGDQASLVEHHRGRGQLAGEHVASPQEAERKLQVHECARPARAAAATAGAPPATSTSLAMAPPSASRYVSRASAASSGSRRLAALRNRLPASPPRRCASAIWACKKSTRACPSSPCTSGSTP